MRIEYHISLKELLAEIFGEEKDEARDDERVFHDSKKTPMTFKMDGGESKRCWNDHHDLPKKKNFGGSDSAFSGIPVRRLADGSYQTYGMFCSYECQYSFAFVAAKNPTFKDSVNLITERFLEEYPGEDVTKIQSSKCFQELKVYGGWKTIEEFRAEAHPSKGTSIFLPLGRAYEN